MNETRKGVGEVTLETPPQSRIDHHRYWDEALDKAIADAEEQGLVPDGGRPFEVVHIANVKRSSPGWVDGYRIELIPR